MDPQTKYEAYSDYELLARLLALTRQTGALNYAVANTKGTRRKRSIAALIDVRESEQLALSEAFRRLPSWWSPPNRNVNRGALLMLRAEKQKRGGKCQKCRRPGNLKFRNLHFYTREGEALPLAMAMGGARTESVRGVLDECDLLCGACARRRGARLLTNGQPSVDRSLR